MLRRELDLKTGRYLLALCDDSKIIQRSCCQGDHILAAGSRLTVQCKSFRQVWENSGNFSQIQIWICLFLLMYKMKSEWTEEKTKSNHYLLWPPFAFLTLKGDWDLVRINSVLRAEKCGLFIPPHTCVRLFQRSSVLVFNPLNSFKYWMRPFLNCWSPVREALSIKRMDAPCETEV